MQKKRPQKRRQLAHFFVPHELNGYHPHILKDVSVWTIVAFVAVLQIGFFTYQFTFFKGGEQMASVLPGVVTALSNEAREAEGAEPLTINPVLTEAAQKKADDMVARHYFAHQEPTGEMPWHWFTDNGYVYSHAGENLAVNFTDTRQLVNAWLASPKHRENILRTQFTDIGVGMATGTHKGREAVFVVQFFGKQKDAPQRTERDPALTSQVPESTDVTDIAVLGVATSDEPQPWFQRFMMSPRTLNGQILLALSVVLIGTLCLTVTSAFQAHPRAILNGFFLVAVIVSLWASQEVLFGHTEVPDDAQAAAVSQML